MTFPRVRTVLAVLMFVLFPFVAASAKPVDSHAADSAAIKKLFADFNTAFNNHDAHAAAMLFTNNADYITTAGVAVHGKAEIDKHLAPLFAGRLKTIRRDVTLRGIRFLSPDIATVDSDFETSGVTGPGGAANAPAKGFYDWIVIKQNGKWLIAAWHESNLPAPPVGGAH